MRSGIGMIMIPILGISYIQISVISIGAGIIVMPIPVWMSDQYQ